MRIILLCLFALNAWAGYEMSSAQMQKYSIENCSTQKCFRVQGETAYFSNDGATATGDQVKLELYDVKSKAKEAHSCETFRYNFVSKVLLCENLETPKAESLIINAKFEVRKFKL